MSAEVKINPDLSKEEKYTEVINAALALTEAESNFISNISNITSLLKYAFNEFLWVGFYFTDLKKDNELVLGPFQGRVACTRIKFGKGVCGTAAMNKESIIVANVDEYPGHIVCDSLSKSEIVIPVIKDEKTIGVLDIDSGIINFFDETDKYYLEMLLDKIIYIFK